MERTENKADSDQMGNNNDRTGRTVYRRRKSEPQAESKQNSENGKRSARSVSAKSQGRGQRTALRQANAPRQPKEPSRKTPVKIIPLGGLNEIGKNCTAIECANDMIIIDCGMAFPDSELFGVDIVLPDYSYAVLYNPL